MRTDHRSPSSTRDVARRTKRGGRAYVTSSLKDDPVEIRLESKLEGSVFKALHLDPRALRIRTQPYTADLTTGELIKDPAKIVNGSRRYTPDLGVELIDVSVAIEVK